MNQRIQEVIRSISAGFLELGSARQVLLSMADQGIHFPRPSDGIRLTSFEWRPIRYRNVIGILKNTFYAGVYAYGKTGRKTEIRNGRAHVSDEEPQVARGSGRGHARPPHRLHRVGRP